MCDSLEAAQVRCRLIYGHTNVGRPDIDQVRAPYQGGCYFSAPEDLQWAVRPHHGDPGVLEIRPGARPICLLTRA